MIVMSKTFIGLMSVIDYLAYAIELDRVGKTDHALDVIYSEIDHRLRQGMFVDIDELLAITPVDDLSVIIMLGLLTVTLMASDRLPHRGAWFRQAHAEVIRRGEDEPGLFDGLEGVDG